MPDRYCIMCDAVTRHEGNRCTVCNHRTRRLSMRVDLLPTIVNTPVVHDVDEKSAVRIVETFYCNATGAERTMYGHGEEGVKHAVLVVHLTKERHEAFEWLPCEDDEPYNPGDGGC